VNISGLVQEMTLTVSKLNCQKGAITKKIDHLTSRLEKAKRLNQEIKGLKEQPAFMTEDGTREEEMKTNCKLEEPKQIIQQIEQLQSEANFLDRRQIQNLKMKIENLQFQIRNEEEEPTDCFNCVNCKTAPQSKNGELIIHSCLEDHLLCNNCFPTLDKCPGKL
jgi:hypothetical protein